MRCVFPKSLKGDFCHHKNGPSTGATHALDIISLFIPFPFDLQPTS